MIIYFIGILTIFMYNEKIGNKRRNEKLWQNMQSDWITVHCRLEHYL